MPHQSRLDPLEKRLIRQAAQEVAVCGFGLVGVCVERGGGVGGWPG
jgi:hypothetical protein